MKKIGMFYSFNTTKTAKIAEKISNVLGNNNLVEHDVESLTKEQFLAFNNIIVGVSTWWDGELPTYWDELMPTIEDMDLKGKKIAIFGLGNQKDYPQNFADAIGIMAKAFEERGAKIIGFTSVDGYTYEKSRAVRDGKFMGLALDQENQGMLTNERVLKWAEQIRLDFNL